MLLARFARSNQFIVRSIRTHVYGNRDFSNRSQSRLADARPLNDSGIRNRRSARLVNTALQTANRASSRPVLFAEAVGSVDNHIVVSGCALLCSLPVATCALVQANFVVVDSSARFCRHLVCSTKSFRVDV